MGTLYVTGIVGEIVPEETRRLLSSSMAALVCSRSTYTVISRSVPEAAAASWLSITPIQKCLTKIRQRLEHGPIVVVVTGDPLFFGFGRLLRKTFASQPIIFLPYLSTMQLCFSRFGISWDDAEFISLHGRPLRLLEQKLRAQKLFIFTDRNSSPPIIARFLIDRFGNEEAGRYRMYVGESLATAAERLITGSPEAIAGQSFQEPNSLILQDTVTKTVASEPLFGLHEIDFSHRSGLITKNEVRAAVLHTLALPGKGVLWDVGAGSGSVGIEAARLFPSLTVYCVEKEAARLIDIKKNRQRFCCWNLVVVPGTAPAVLHRLPLPDRIFIGGSGGNLEPMLRFITEMAGKRPRIVLTAVRAQTRAVASALLHDRGYRVRISRIATSRQVYPNPAEVTYNPIDIISAEKEDEPAEE